MKTFNEFINEGVIDYLKPKSKEELKDSMDNIDNIFIKLSNIQKYNLTDKWIPTDIQLRKEFNEYTNDLITTYEESVKKGSNIKNCDTCRSKKAFDAYNKIGNIYFIYKNNKLIGSMLTKKTFNLFINQKAIFYDLNNIMYFIDSKLLKDFLKNKKFINEKYDFKLEDNGHRIKYYFTNKDGIDFEVYFDEKISNEYAREYRIVSKKIGSFEEINTGDSIGILKTITNITLDFIKNFNPKSIKIWHIPTKKERKVLRDKEIDHDYDYWLKTPTKRAIINKRFLERDLPSNYEYKLKGMMSVITKKGFVNEKYSENTLPSDALRMDLIEEFLDELKKDEDYNIEEVEYDSLLDTYDGYSWQTYIENLGNGEFDYWEGWTEECWDGLYGKVEYEGLSKEEALQKIFDERIPQLASEFNLTILDSKYFWHQTWTDDIEDGYIMRITFKINN